MSEDNNVLKHCSINKEGLRVRTARNLAFSIEKNVRFHKTTAVLDSLRSRSIAFKFLVPYSPELNPIEEFFSMLNYYDNYNYKTVIKIANCNIINHYIKINIGENRFNYFNFSNYILYYLFLNKLLVHL